jgi:hypothetical protein
MADDGYTLRCGPRQGVRKRVRREPAMADRDGRQIIADCLGGIALHE